MVWCVISFSIPLSHPSSSCCSFFLPRSYKSTSIHWQESKEEQQFGRYYCSRVVVTIVIIVIKIVMRQHHRYRNCDRGCLSPASKSRSMNGI
mmetsp:Transcript_36277/g.40483  ORF Transcript_36277/g.40483 Transcript_36277/m.40483 type:complete len:92 (+) Transcript_36277:196-471(+)